MRQKTRPLREIRISFAVEERDWQQLLGNKHVAMEGYETDDERVAAVLADVLVDNGTGCWHIDDLVIEIEGKRVIDEVSDAD